MLQTLPTFNYRKPTPVPLRPVLSVFCLAINIDPMFALVER